MKIIYQLKPLLLRLIPLVVFLLFFYTILEIVIVYKLLISESEKDLRDKVDRVREDIVLKNGVWDVSAYNSDSNISNEDPLYVITSEGFIIERNKPIHGLLDLSRYSAIAGYSTPQTLTTVTEEKWRVFSAPLLAEEKPLGIVMVATYDPEERNLEEIDRQNQEIIDKIKSNVRIEGENIDISLIDVRTIPFNTSFQIVNRFNKVILQSNNNNSVNRIPSFIDRSYIENQLKGSKQKQVEDAFSHKKFLIRTEPFFDERNLIAGIIVTGVPIDYIYKFLLSHALINLLVNVLAVILLVPVISYLLRFLFKDDKEKPQIKAVPKVISFMKKTCKLSIDQRFIDIPYASFQYYFCDALFSKPKKKWEADELLEIFGEDFGVEKWRKVYDTMVALDRKTSAFVDKLFIVKDKRYFVNPQLIHLVKYINT